MTRTFTYARNEGVPPSERIYLHEEEEIVVAEYLRHFTAKRPTGEVYWTRGMGDQRLVAMLEKERGIVLSIDTLGRVRRKHIGRMQQGPSYLATQASRPAPEPEPPAPEPPPVAPPPDPAATTYATLIALYLALDRQVAAMDAKIEKLLELWK